MPALDEFKAQVDTKVRYHTTDHVPAKAIERMALALMAGNLDERTTNLYKVIIHFQAAAVLYTSLLLGTKSEAVTKHYQQMQYDHITAALTALDTISFMTAPSLPLVQALVTGVSRARLCKHAVMANESQAMMMQIIGNPVQCWELTAHASQTIIALGYHHINKMAPETDEEHEIYSIVAHCAELDSAMSLLLLRPRSLPKFQVKIYDMMRGNPANPMSVLEMLYLQDKILDLTLASGPKRSPNEMKEEVAQLRAQMKDIYVMIEKVNQPLCAQARCAHANSGLGA